MRELLCGTCVLAWLAVCYKRLFHCLCGCQYNVVVLQFSVVNGSVHHSLQEGRVAEAQTAVQPVWKPWIC